MVLSSCLWRARGDRASLEDAERVLLLRALVANLDDLRQRMGTEWKAFANELFHRLLPTLMHEEGGFDVSALRSHADAIKEQLLTWPGEGAKHLRDFVVLATRGATGLVLPKRWREKQELLNLFQQMYSRLERAEGPSQDLGAAGNQGEQTTEAKRMKKEARPCGVLLDYVGPKDARACEEALEFSVSFCTTVTVEEFDLRWDTKSRYDSSLFRRLDGFFFGFEETSVRRHTFYRTGEELFEEEGFRVVSL